MKEIMQKAKEGLQAEVGQDKVMVLATRREEGVAARTVNVYIYEDCFYFITELDSNKYMQIRKHDKVALSIDAIQIMGTAELLEHPCNEINKPVADYVGKVLPRQFDRYAARENMRLIKVTPELASFISLQTGAGYWIDFIEDTAMAIRHDME